MVYLWWDRLKYWPLRGASRKADLLADAPTYFEVHNVIGEVSPSSDKLVWSTKLPVR